MSQVIASLLLVPHLSVINHYAQGGGAAGWQNRETQDAQYGYLPMNHLAKAAPTDFLSHFASEAATEATDLTTWPYSASSTEARQPTESPKQGNRKHLTRNYAPGHLRMSKRARCMKGGHVRGLWASVHEGEFEIRLSLRDKLRWLLQIQLVGVKPPATLAVTSRAVTNSPRF